MAEAAPNYDALDAVARALADGDNKSVVVYTGAGVSVSAGIAPFRDGATGEGVRSVAGIGVTHGEADQLFPTYAHLAVAALVRACGVRVVTSNHDNLHVASGVPPEHVAAVFGCGHVETCVACKREFRRHTQTPPLGRKCERCGGRLRKCGVRFGGACPERELARAARFADSADVALV
eukprot:CAMPEP_0198363102 /NCGR_PEP_ID=MMETSP1450-20131203/148599_1 /TAXON_ID=753684 ORGANISM="Madagascaria erythrocladiodes, Strain CCMP3234" /NCGR_SAMPLE_ID=MMETSP1450 /ASSEMBLY_ACC=CAM_ASM_001115 /LENGTH=177 /DNA_ID=CAMNT_0044070403 /DNA_START=15 /DNA_END=545 /DNA_ORIENTATION=+